MFASTVDCWPEASVRVIRGHTCLTGARTIRENQELKDIDSWIIAAEGIAASSQVNKGGVSVEKCEGRDTITLGTAALPLSSGNYCCWPPLTSFSNFYFQISNSPPLDLLKLSTCGQWLLVSHSKDLLYEKKVAERENKIKNTILLACNWTTWTDCRQGGSPALECCSQLLPDPRDPAFQTFTQASSQSIEFTFYYNSYHTTHLRHRGNFITGPVYFARFQSIIPQKDCFATNIFSRTMFIINF